MLGLVLVMHAPLGSAMAECVEHVMGSLPEGFAVVDVPADEPIEQTVLSVREAAKSVHCGAGVVFMTDLFGATPSNAAVRGSVEDLSIPSVLVSGCNLPMILRSLGFRDLSVSAVAERLVAGGRNGIVSTGATALQTQTHNPVKEDGSARDQHQQ